MRRVGVGTRPLTPLSIETAMSRSAPSVVRMGTGACITLTFQADDGVGGQCTGQVTVCVPGDRHHPTCVDDGQRYEATQR